MASFSTAGGGWQDYIVSYEAFIRTMGLVRPYLCTSGSKLLDIKGMSLTPILDVPFSLVCAALFLVLSKWKTQTTIAKERLHVRT